MVYMLALESDAAVIRILGWFLWYGAVSWRFTVITTQHRHVTRMYTKPSLEVCSLPIHKH